MSTNKGIIVRFPPSPTGFLQMGNVRTLIYNYLFARKNGGKFILRIEDTDKERSKKEYEQAIYEDVAWLGLKYDNPDDVWRSSERTEIYKKAIHDLIDKNFAYISHETEGENREVVRFRNPGGKIKFTDLIRGEIEIDVTDLGDFIIARNIDDPLYHLAVCVDDAASGITHIIRGDDHISNTPRHILIIQALGGQIPIYAHLPMVLAEDKSKLSKRKHGEVVSIRYYKEKGYEPEAIVNFLSLIGWNPGTDQEVFSLEELIEVFDLSKVQKKGGVFNVEKLNWLNREHILRQSAEKKFSIFNFQFSKTKWRDNPKSKDKEFMHQLMQTLLDRIHRWGEVSELLEAGEYDYLFEEPKYDSSLLIWKKSDQEKTKSHLNKILEMISSENDIEKLWQNIFDLAIKEGKGEVLWPLRYALSGKEKSPDPLTLIKILGQEEVTNRVLKAIEKLSN